MGFDAAATNQKISESMNAMLLLHASCQGIIEATIQPSESGWYQTISSELAAAEELVVSWRQNGFLYFQQDILGQIIGCGQTFLDAEAGINGLFEKLEQNFSQAIKQEVMDALRQLTAPINGMVSQIGAYGTKLQDFEAKMQVPYGRMDVTITQIQAQESSIEAEIASINAEITAMEKQIQADRTAIAKARKARERGIIETVFGVLLAPISGGASLILAGIGVATIAEAEDKIKNLESGIRKSQQQISQDQKQLSDDHKEIATLRGLSLCLKISLSDMKLIQAALDPLRTTWAMLSQELTDEISKVDAAEHAQEAIVAQVWFQAACNEWRVVVAQSQDFNQRTLPPEPTRVTIG